MHVTTAHCLQVEAPEVPAKFVPTVQEVQAEAPYKLKLPAEQVMQPSTPVIPRPVLYVPLPHWVHTVAAVPAK